MTEPHPLESIVWQAFAKRKCHDATSLGYFLAGAVVRPGARAYHTVAKDTLSYMESQGLLQRDSSGWYHKTPGAAPPARVRTRIRNTLSNLFSDWKLTDAEILEKAAGLSDRQLMRIENFGLTCLEALRKLQRAHYGLGWEPPSPEPGDPPGWRSPRQASASQ